MSKTQYMLPAAFIVVLMLVSPVLAGQLTAYGVLAFAGYKGAKYFLKRGGRR
jgi:hypothetical protein